MLSGPYEPITVDDQKATCYLAQVDIFATRYLPRVLCQPATKCGVQSFASINNFPVSVERIDALTRRGYVLRERM